MKKHIFTIALVSCSLVYFISCSDKDDTAAGTCSDGIKNQTETGVDCGGPCGACPTCTDGIKNGTETGVDCGGTCTACTPSCSDGIKNQGETGVDCGGPCPACPTCSDNIQNQGETGIDCGGPCPPCSTPSCSDGILNQGESQIDCGGPCPACPTATMTSLVDGVAWSSTATGFPLITHAGGIFLLNGTQISPNGIISITMPSTAGSTGFFPLSSTTCYYTNATNTYPGVSGTLEITTWNATKHRVSGHFNFTATLGSVTHTITSGNFTNVYYTN